MEITDELVEKLWSQGARTRKSPKATIRERIKAKWRRTLQSAITAAKREAWKSGHRLIILESKTRCLMQSWTNHDDEIFYSVDLEDMVCTCPAYEFSAKGDEKGRSCKHLKMFAGMMTDETHRAIESARGQLPPPGKIIGISGHLQRSAQLHRRAS